MTNLKAKRIRRDPEVTRKLILDATEQIMLDEGYAAVSSRRIAQELSINAATVHYYYATTDDLFIALYKRMTVEQLEALRVVLASSNPLDALWTYQLEGAQSALGIEFVALSNHRKVLQPIIAAVANKARQSQAEALAPVLVSMGVDDALLPPLAVATLIVAITRTLKNEERIGLTVGHDEVRAFCQNVLSGLSQTTGR